MKNIERIKLSDVLRLVSKPKYVLGTTYTLSLAFFESVVYPYIQNNQLKSAIILCDRLGYRRALAESAALQGAAQDYLVVPAPISGAFHPKVWVVVGEGEAVLITGSGNLTQSGFMSNAEYFDAVYFSAKERQPRHLIQSLKSFVTGLVSMWPQEDSKHLLCIEVLNHIAEAIENLSVSSRKEGEGPWFIHSFKGQLIDQLPNKGKVRDLYVAAPFFGNSLSGLKSVAKRYDPKKLHLFPAVHGGDCIDVPLKKLTKEFKDAEVSPLSTVAKKGALAHLKLYGAVENKDSAWICCTSANCTQAAWKGPNVEAGLVRRVDKSTCQEYFIPAKGKLPEKALEFKGEASDMAELPCWASDSGGSLDIAVPANAQDMLPLKNVVLTVRSGNRLATCAKEALFLEGSAAKISWSVFDAWERARKMAVSLEISAKDCRGDPVRGQCLIENRLLLTADPVHRSAWRGALALLDSEGVPELGDISALFSLANDLFEGHVFRDDCYLDGVTNNGYSSGVNVIVPTVAIWPPRPDMRELQQRIGRTAVGQIQWFQRIFQTFLRCEKEDDSSVAATGSASDAEIEEPHDKGEASQQQEEEENRARVVANRIWKHTYREFSRLQNRLLIICPTEEQAPNLWAAAIFTFLPTLAIMRVAYRMAPDLDCETNVEYMIEDFLRSLLDSRKQSGSFCCPRGHRYYPLEIFPSLVKDLRETYKIKIHPDLSIVLLALITDWKLRSKNLYPQLWERLVRQVCDPEFKLGMNERKPCRRIWRHYVMSNDSKCSDRQFDTAFDELCRLRE